MPDDVLSSDAPSPGAPAPADSIEHAGQARESQKANTVEKRLGQSLPSIRKAAGSLALVATEKIADDDQFRLLPLGEVDALAQSMAQLGQLFPIELRVLRPNQYQLIVGFRRVAAARLLQRPRMLARVHPDPPDSDALLMALADLCAHAPEKTAALEAVRDRLSSEGRLFPQASEMIEQAIARSREKPAESPSESGGEVDLDVLCDDVTARIAQINQDLASIAEMWSDVEPAQRRLLLEQLRYPAELAEYLETLE